MQQVRHRIGKRFEQGDRAGDADAAGQKVGNAEGHGKVNGGEGGGLGQAQAKWNAHKKPLGLIVENELYLRLSLGSCKATSICLPASAR
jgi:hypothetical protein